MRGRPGAAKEPLLPASLRVRRRHGPRGLGGGMAPGPAAAQGGREPGPAPVWEEGRLPPEQRRERGEEGRKDQMGEDGEVFLQIFTSVTTRGMPRWLRTPEWRI